MLSRFSALDGLLRHTQPLWQEQPFHHLRLPWWQTHPALCEALAALALPDLQALEQDEAARAALLWPLVPEASELAALCHLPRLPSTSPPPAPAHVPGRKWSQIWAFAQQLGLAAGCGPGHLLEWCAGKGHLGRLLARQGHSVVSLEWDAELCLAARQLSTGLPQQTVQQDVMAAEATGWLAGARQAVALHACGDLHRHLIRQGAAQQVASLSLAPCCYHKHAHEYYQPLSQAAQASGLPLNRRLLQLPLQETVTAGARVRRLRWQELSWRLTFDALQRDLRGENSYLPLPSFAKGLLAGELTAFIDWAAQTKGLILPAPLDLAPYQQQAEIRLAQVLRMELVLGLFRRPVELWLVLDYALYLEEQGYVVSLGEFCERPLTPRNLLLQAHRRADSEGGGR